MRERGDPAQGAGSIRAEGLFRRRAYRGVAQHLSGLPGNRGAFEEIRVLHAPESHRIGESEITEVGGGNQAVLDQLVSFR